MRSHDHTSQVKVAQQCRRLSVEFLHYIIEARALRKVCHLCQCYHGSCDPVGIPFHKRNILSGRGQW